MKSLVKLSAIISMLMIGACHANFSLAPYSSFPNSMEKLKGLWANCEKCLESPKCEEDKVRSCKETTLPSRTEALSLAVGRANMEAIKFLVDVAKADVNSITGEYKETPLMIASYYSDATHKDVLEFLLKRGADVNAVGTSEYTTALLTALWKNNTMAAKKLLENGADPSITTLSGINACKLAIFRKKSILVPLMKNCCAVALGYSFAAQEVRDACE